MTSVTSAPHIDVYSFLPPMARALNVYIGNGCHGCHATWSWVSCSVAICRFFGGYRGALVIWRTMTPPTHAQNQSVSGFPATDPTSRHTKRR